MTLIAGVRCKDGVVIGADGAATSAAYATSTIRQSTHKLAILKHKLILGVSGPVGFAQRYAYHLEQVWEANKLSGLNPVPAMEVIRAVFWNKVIQNEIGVASASKGIHGGLAVQSATASALLAVPLGNEAHLFEFDHQGAPEMASEDLSFKAIGSGQPIADPFLAFIKRVFWRDGCPNTAEGTLAVLWTLQHAIQTSPGGVADPIQVSVLKKDGGGWVASILTDEELEEHSQQIADMEQNLYEWREEQRTGEAHTDVDNPPE